MILYVDETESDDYFILTGLLVENRYFVDMAYKHFKNRIKYYPLNKHAKERIYIEFKSFILDKHYQRIKNIMLEEIAKIDNCKILYSIKRKKYGHFKQSDKENTYIELIAKLAKECGDVSIIFDSFNNPRFEAKIIDKLCKLDNVVNARPMNSQDDHGLIFVDNLCGAIRLYISNLDTNGYYNKILSKVIEI